MNCIKHIKNTSNVKLQFPVSKNVEVNEMVFDYEQRNLQDSKKCN